MFKPTVAESDGYDADNDISPWNPEKRVKTSIRLSSSVGDPDPEPDPHVFGGTDPDPFLF
jgi:hypothetical protein